MKSSRVTQQDAPMVEVASDRPLHVKRPSLYPRGQKIKTKSEQGHKRRLYMVTLSSLSSFGTLKMEFR